MDVLLLNQIERRKIATNGSENKKPSRTPRFVSKTLSELPSRLNSTRVGLSAQEFRKIISGEKMSKIHLQVVQDFFRYTDTQGKAFFDELDEDGDGRLKTADLKRALKARNLPENYAHSFMRRAKRHWWSDSIGWREFKAVMGEKESSMLRAFNAMNLNYFDGTLNVSSIKNSLHKLEKEPSEENANAMIKHLGAVEDGYVSYGSFRNFLILLPPERDLSEMDAQQAWYEAATFVPLCTPLRKGASGMSLVLAAVAGGLASGSSTATMHPLDTIKTQVQTSVGRITFQDLKTTWTTLGAVGLYRGILPATLGACMSHGIRTATYEAVQAALKPLQETLPQLSDIQIQGFASGVGTLLGTSVRIPHEVLKQRLQCGQYSGALAALRGTLQEEGVRGLFRGTAATMGREVPFYVIGMVTFEQLKLARIRLKREDKPQPLAIWETLLLGAVSGAIAAALTTPADVLKTRAMTGAIPAGMGILEAVKTISINEGPATLFKGALPRACWVSPLGAMNFAGYEIAKRALDANVDDDEQAIELDSLDVDNEDAEVSILKND